MPAQKKIVITILTSKFSVITEREIEDCFVDESARIFSTVDGDSSMVNIRGDRRHVAVAIMLRYGGC